MNDASTLAGLRKVTKHATSQKCKEFLKNIENTKFWMCTEIMQFWISKLVHPASQVMQEPNDCSIFVRLASTWSSVRATAWTSPDWKLPLLLALKDVPVSLLFCWKTARRQWASLVLYERFQNLVYQVLKGVPFPNSQTALTLSLFWSRSRRGD